MKLVEGDTYRTRDGFSAFTVYRSDFCEKPYVFCSMGVFDEGLTWTEDGEMFEDEENELDLVERVLITPFEEK
jgi:hypothetical protein